MVRIYWSKGKIRECSKYQKQEIMKRWEHTRAQKRLSVAVFAEWWIWQGLWLCCTLTWERHRSSRSSVCQERPPSALTSVVSVKWQQHIHSEQPGQWWAPCRCSDHTVWYFQVLHHTCKTHRHTDKLVPIYRRQNKQKPVLTINAFISW